MKSLTFTKAEDWQNKFLRHILLRNSAIRLNFSANFNSQTLHSLVEACIVRLITHPLSKITKSRMINNLLALTQNHLNLIKKIFCSQRWDQFKRSIMKAVTSLGEGCLTLRVLRTHSSTSFFTFRCYTLSIISSSRPHLHLEFLPRYLSLIQSLLKHNTSLKGSHHLTKET